MEQSEILLRLLVSIILGAILGLESETREIEKKGTKKAEEEEKTRLGGLRTYTVLSLFGGIAGLLFVEGYEIFSYIMFSGLSLLILSAYYLNVQSKSAFGITTEIAILITFILGFLTTSDIFDLSIVLFILVILSFFLSQKRGFGKLIKRIEHKELIDVIKFGLIAVVVLPLLPDKDFYISDFVEFVEPGQTLGLSENVMGFTLLNPFKMWFIVVLISGFNLAGYLLSKFVGAKKGVPLASFIGGLISSTSTTIALATKSKAEDNQKSGLFAGSAIISNAASFIDTSIILLVSSSIFFREIFPALFMMFLIGIITGIYFVLRRSTTFNHNDFEINYEPFSIMPAVKFVSLIIIIKLFVQALQLLELGNLSLAITTISGLTGLDPAAIALSDLVKDGSLTLNVAVITLLATNVVNFLAKIFYGYIGGRREFSKILTMGLLITLFGSGIVVFSMV